jgi:hypothetical protein
MPDVTYVPSYEPGQFDDAPENEQQINNELDNNIKDEDFNEEEEDFDDYFEDELNDNEEWENASGGNTIYTFEKF